jgi:hypothetical protein
MSLLGNGRGIVRLNRFQSLKKEKKINRKKDDSFEAN